MTAPFGMKAQSPGQSLHHLVPAQTECTLTHPWGPSLHPCGHRCARAHIWLFSVQVPRPAATSPHHNAQFPATFPVCDTNWAPTQEGAEWGLHSQPDYVGAEPQPRLMWSPSV